MSDENKTTKVDLGETLGSVKPEHVENLVGACYIGIFSFYKKIIRQPWAKVAIVAILLPFILIFTFAVVFIGLAFYNLFLLPR